MAFLRKFCHLLLTLIVTLFCSLAQAKIVKWVDDAGVTHYGDQLPTQYAGKSSSEISVRGVVIKQNKVVDIKAEQVSQEKLEQDKKDKALLASYTTVQEIDMARERNLQLDLATLQNLAQQKKVLEKHGATIAITSDNLVKQKKPFPANLVSEIATYKADLTKVDSQIGDRKLSMDLTKQRYGTEKLRFIVLKSLEGGTANAGATSTSPASPLLTKPVSNK